MKSFFTLITSVLIFAQSTVAHYQAREIEVNGKRSSKAIRQPESFYPILDIQLPEITCNKNKPASETIEVAAGSEITFYVDNPEGFFHPGTGAIYLGEAPAGVPVSNWDGKGDAWFKIAEWGATFNPFKFVIQNTPSMTARIPADIRPGEYLARVEQIAFHRPSTREMYISCAQLKITGSGNASPPKVAIPGYIKPEDKWYNASMYYPVPTEWRVAGPSVYVAGPLPSTPTNLTTSSAAVPVETPIVPSPVEVTVSETATPTATTPASGRPTGSCGGKHAIRQRRRGY